MRSPDEHRTLLLAPVGRDAEVAQLLLREAGYPALACASLDELCHELRFGARLVLVTEEAFGGADLRPLSDWLRAQPPWGDLPFVVLTRRTTGLEQNPAALRLMRLLGNVSFLERPFHPTTLVSLVEAAARQRERQYLARDYLLEREQTVWTIQQGAERLNFALLAGRLGAWELDIEHEALTASEVCKANFGRAPRDRFSYRDLLAAVHTDDRERVEDALGRALAGKAELDLEARVVWPDDSVHWVQVRGRLSEGAGRHMAGVSLDITHRKRTEEHQWLLTAELDHRVKNMLAVIQSLVLQSKNGAASLDEFAQTLGGRIQAVARANSLLSESRWEGASLHSIIAEELRPYRADSGERVVLEGPDMLLRPKPATALGMAVHELATNAAKHGALSAPGGSVRIRSGVVDSAAGRLLRLRWEERGGPPVTAPTRRGFGSTLIERSLAYEVAGRARLDFRPEGLVCRIEIPEDQLLRIQTSGAAEHPGASSRDESTIATEVARRILVVEDSALVAMEVESAVRELGWHVVGPLNRVKHALEAASRESLDGAVLDVNLDGEEVYPVAEMLHSRGVPFVFATGYDRESVLPSRFQSAPALQKPFTADGLKQSLLKLVAA